MVNQGPTYISTVKTPPTCKNEDFSLVNYTNYPSSTNNKFKIGNKIERSTYRINSGPSCRLDCPFSYRVSRVCYDYGNDPTGHNFKGSCPWLLTQSPNNCDCCVLVPWDGIGTICAFVSVFLLFPICVYRSYIKRFILKLMSRGVKGGNPPEICLAPQQQFQSTNQQQQQQVYNQQFAPQGGYNQQQQQQFQATPTQHLPVWQQQQLEAARQRQQQQQQASAPMQQVELTPQQGFGQV